MPSASTASIDFSDTIQERIASTRKIRQVKNKRAAAIELGETFVKQWGLAEFDMKKSDASDLMDYIGTIVDQHEVLNRLSACYVSL